MKAGSFQIDGSKLLILVALVATLVAYVVVQVTNHDATFLQYLLAIEVGALAGVAIPTAAPVALTVEQPHQSE